MTRKITAADCRSCGACCVGVDDGYGLADCTEEDVKRMSRRVREMVVYNDYGYVAAVTPTVKGGACAFLRGTVGSKVSCRIYATRPDICREFKPGSRGCLASRREADL